MSDVEESAMLGHGQPMPHSLRTQDPQQRSGGRRPGSAIQLASPSRSDGNDEEEFQSAPDQQASHEDDLGSQNPRKPESPTKRRFAWLTMENAKKTLRAFFNLLTFLTPLALIGTGMYVSIIAIPAISAGLTAALGLGFPHAAITIIAILPIIVMSAVLLRFMQIHWEIRKDQYNEAKAKAKAKAEAEADGDDVNQLKALSMSATVKYLLGLTLPSYLIALVERAFLLDVEKTDEVAQALEEGAPTLNGDRSNIEDVKAYQRLVKWTVRFQRYNILAAGAALGLGTYLAVYVVPFLMNSVIALGVPFPVAVLFGAVAAATIVAITYNLLALGVTLRNIALKRGELKTLKGYNTYALFYVTGAAIVVALSAGAAYVFFPVVVNALAPVLSPGLATFTAVAVSVSLALVMMRFVPQTFKLIVAIPGEIKSSYKEFKAWKLKRQEQKTEAARLKQLSKPAPRAAHAQEASAEGEKDRLLPSSGSSPSDRTPADSLAPRSAAEHKAPAAAADAASAPKGAKAAVEQASGDRQYSFWERNVSKRKEAAAAAAKANPAAVKPPATQPKGKAAPKASAGSSGASASAPSPAAH